MNAFFKQWIFLKWHHKWFAICSRKENISSFVFLEQGISDIVHVQLLVLNQWLFATVLCRPLRTIFFILTYLVIFSSSLENQWPVNVYLVIQGQITTMIHLSTRILSTQRLQYKCWWQINSCLFSNSSFLRYHG